MSTIQDLFQQAQLAEAAYANFAAFPNDDIGVFNALKANDFSDQQATDFLTHWRYVDQFTDSGLFGLTDGSGFSATLFESLGHPGQYTFAMRGSQSWVDFTEADVSLGTGGIAFEQLVAMVNYVLRLDVGATGQTAQLKATMVAGALPVVSWDTAMVQGEGPGISLNSLTVTGHSLGGALAQMFQRIFGSTGVYTYNAVWIGYPNAPVFDQITTLLGLPPGSFSSGAGDNLLVPGEPANYLGAVQGNPQQQIFTETADTNLISAHLIAPVSDSLALYNLFARLEPTAGINTITSILKASSNVAVNSLESAISALGKLFLVNGAAGYNGNEFDSGVTGRDLLYTALNDISAALPAGSFTLRDLSAFNAAQIASVAQGNIAYRYALVNGNPFALSGDDTLYTAHNTGGELDLFDTATGQGALTAQYLTDRSDYLTKLLARNVQDSTAGRLSAGGGDTLYRDSGTGAVTEFRTGSLLATDDARKHFEFGGGQGETISGGMQGDHLYGMGGNDGGAGMSPYIRMRWREAVNNAERRMAA